MCFVLAHNKLLQSQKTLKYETMNFSGTTIINFAVPKETLKKKP